MFKCLGLYNPFRPFKGRGSLVVTRYKIIDRIAQLLDRGKSGSLQGLAAEDPGPAFNLVEPRGVGGRVMTLDAGVACEPTVVLRLMGV